MKKDPPRVEPPCATCRPGLVPENETALEIYSLCSDDWRTDAMGGLRGLDAPAIVAALDIAGVTGRDRRRLYEEVKLIGRTIAGELASERKQREEERDGKAQR